MDDAFTLGVYKESEQKKAASQGQAGKTASGDGTLTYASAFGKDAQLTFRNTECGVSGSIVLDHSSEENAFTFVFRSSSHRPMLAEGGCHINIVRLDDPSAVEYQLPDLYAHDSYTPSDPEQLEEEDFRHLNEDCRYELTALEDGSYLITAAIPREWLDNSAVVYPVTLNASITVYNNSNQVSDSFVDEASPNSNYGGENYFRIGCSSSKRKFSFIRFDAFSSSLPAAPHVITSANLHFRFRSGQTTCGTGVIWRVISSWSENSITWNNMPSYQYPDYIEEAAVSWNGSYLYAYDFDVTELAAGWKAGTYPNQGVMLSYASHWYNDTNSFVSSDGEVERLPSLTVNYMYTATPGITSGTRYYLRNQNSGMYLDAEQDMNFNVIQYAFRGDTNQQWIPIYVGDGYYKLQNQYPAYQSSAYYGRCYLSVGEGTSWNADLFWNSSTPGNLGYETQRFRIIPNGDGSYRLLCKYQESYQYVISVENASLSSTANVRRSTWYGGSSQKWHIEPIYVAGRDYLLSTATEKHPGFGSKAFGVSLFGSHRSDVLAAMSGWGRAGAIITEDNSSYNSISVGDFWGVLPDTLGDYQATATSGGHATKFLIRIHESHVDDYLDSVSLTAQQRETAFRNTIAHELGHALGLNDNPTGAPSIMKYSYIPWSNYYPEKADIAGVTDYYN